MYIWGIFGIFSRAFQFFFALRFDSRILIWSVDLWNWIPANILLESAVFQRLRDSKWRKIKCKYARMVCGSKPVSRVFFRVRGVASPIHHAGVFMCLRWNLPTGVLLIFQFFKFNWKATIFDNFQKNGSRMFWIKTALKWRLTSLFSANFPNSYHQLMGSYIRSEKKVGQFRKFDQKRLWTRRKFNPVCWRMNFSLFSYKRWLIFLVLAWSLLGTIKNDFSSKGVSITIRLIMVSTNPIVKPRGLQGYNSVRITMYNLLCPQVKTSW